MQPNNPYQPAPEGIDYLNQIAPPSKPAGFDKKTKIIMAVLGLIGVFSLIFIFVMASNQSNSGPSPLKLTARLQKMQNFTTKYGPKLRAVALQDANSSLSAILTTANQSISKPLQAAKIDIKKQAKQIAAIDTGTKEMEVLDNAYLNNSLDSAYAHEINVQLESTLVMMKSLLRSTRSSSMKEFLTKTISDFENLQKQFDAIVKNN